MTDLNGDGKPDLAALNRLDNTVGVLLNDSFPGQIYTVDQPTKLVFTQQPPNTVAGNVLNTFQVTVEDRINSAVSIDSSVVTLTLNTGVFASSSNTVTSMAVNGIAYFGNVIINTAGFYTLTATDGTLTSVYSNLFSIRPAAAAKLTFTQQPGNVIAGAAVTPAAIAAIQDQFGNRITGNASTVTVTLNGGTFASGGNTGTAAAVSGLATFNNLKINAAGNYTLTASDGTLTGATSGTFTVAPAAAAKLVITQQPGNSMAGVAINPAVWVAVQDQFGNTAAMDNSTVTLTLNGGTFAGGGTTAATTAANGVATFNNLIINVAGNYTLTAGDGVLTDATSESFAVYPLGDVNHDSAVNAAGIDSVYANFGSACTSQWKLCQDGNPVNQADVDYLVKTILQAGYADADLNGKVDFEDFQALLDHWQLKVQGWAGGDWNGDGVTDFMDFQMLLDNWNPNGVWGSSEEVSAAASGSGAVQGAAVTEDVSQTVSASMTASVAPAIKWSLSSNLLTPAGAALTSASSDLNSPSIHVADLLAARKASNASGYVPTTKARILSRRSSLADASWTSDKDKVDLLTQLINPVA